MSGSISGPCYPMGNLVPGFYAAFGATNANTGAADNQQTVIISQQTAAGGAYVLGTPTLIGSTATAIAMAGGGGSMLGRMIARYRRTDTQGTVYAAAIGLTGGPTAGTVVIPLSGTATAAGQIAFQLGDQTTFTGVNIGDTATAVASNMAATINSSPTAIGGGAAVAGTLTITANNNGLVAGDMPVAFNPGGPQAGQSLPAGITVGAITTTAGTGTPNLANLFSNMGTLNFDFIVCPYSDTATLNSLTAFLSQTGGRWSITQQLYGYGFTAYRGTLSQRTTFSTARNDQFITGLGVNGVPTPIYEVVADFAAVCAVSIKQNPALPLQYLPMTMAAPPPGDIDSNAMAQTSLSDGLSTIQLTPGGTVQLQRACTFYTMNAEGFPDRAWADPETGYTLMACIRSLLAQISSQYGRRILVANGTNIPGGSLMCTAQTLLA